MCGREYAPGSVAYTCPVCGEVGTLDVLYDYPALSANVQRDSLPVAGGMCGTDHAEHRERQGERDDEGGAQGVIQLVNGPERHFTPSHVELVEAFARTLAVGLAAR